MADPSPLAVVYADTLVTALPLILVVGRASEARLAAGAHAARSRAARPPVGPIGGYELTGEGGAEERARDYRNRAYQRIAEVVEETGRRSLRHLAAERRASPIVFADLLSASRSSDADTGAEGVSVGAAAEREALDARLEALFALEPLFSTESGLSRVMLVVFAEREPAKTPPGDDETLGHVLERLASRCKVARVPLVTLDSLPAAELSREPAAGSADLDATERLQRAVTELSKLPLIGAGRRVA